MSWGGWVDVEKFVDDEVASSYQSDSCYYPCHYFYLYYSCYSLLVVRITY